MDSEMDFETLFSYDYAANRWEGESSESETTENTPLLRDAESNTNRNTGTSIRNVASIILLITVLLVGCTIGVYLLMLQYNQDHVLPPKDKMPMRPVTTSEWDCPFHAESIIFEQTGTRQCNDFASCAPLLIELKDKYGVNNSMPYNFLLSSDGTAYEGLGWSKRSPLYPELKPLVLAFIGDFTWEVPDIEQVEMAKTLISDLLDRGFLVKNYTVGGNLYEKFKDSPQWVKIGSGLLYC